MGVYNFRLLGTNHLGRLEKHLNVAISSWAKHWFSEPFEEPNLQLSANERLTGYKLPNNSEWLRFTDEEGRWFALSWGDRSEAELGRHITGALWVVDAVNGSAPVAEAVRKRAQASLGELILNTRQELRKTQLVEADVPEIISLLDRPGSGYVVAACQLGKITFSLILGDGCVDKLLSTDNQHTTKTVSALTELSTAIAGQVAKIRVELGQTELSLGELQELKKGDVVCLTQPLGEPLPVYLDTQKLAVSAYLGLKQRRKAIQLALLDRAPENTA